MSKTGFSLSAGQKVFFLIFFFSLLAVMGISLLAYTSSKSMIEKNTAENTSLAVQQTADKLDLYLKSFAGLAQQIRMNRIVYEGGLRVQEQGLDFVELRKRIDPINDQLNSYRDADREGIYSIALIPKKNYQEYRDTGNGKDGNVLRSFPGPSIKFDDNSSLLFDQIIAAKGETVWIPSSEKGFFGYSYEPTLTMGRLMTDLKYPDKELVLLMEIKVKALDNYLKQLDFGEGSGAFAANGKHHFIASSGADKAGMTSAISEAFSGQKGSVLTTDDAGRERLIVQAKIKSAQWNVFAYLPTERLMAEAKQMFFLLAGSLAVLAIVVGLAFVLSIRFIRMHRQTQIYLKEIEQKNVELAYMDKLKDQFLANTSHELRTPLNGIIGLSESLIDGATGKLSEMTKYNLAMIITSGRRLLNLVNDILDFSKVREKDITLNIEPYRLKDIADTVITMFLPMATGKGLTLNCKIADDLPNVMADANRLQQILYNLIGNAVKFTDQGQVVLQARRLQNEMLLIEVVDTGIGIHPDSQQRIFESFEQAADSDTRKHGGTGLGLSVTKMLVEKHGGAVEVVSMPGQGSTFRFTIPCTEDEAADLTQSQVNRGVVHSEGATAEQAATEGIQKESIDLEYKKIKPRILIVDDEPVNLMVLENHLIQLDVEVIKALSGTEALDWIAQHGKPDVMLLDVMMPNVSGLDVCVTLREKYRSGDLPIILLTAKSQVSDLVKGFDAGANDYLVKPFSKNELFARLRLHLKLADWNHQLEEFVRARTNEIKSLLDHADQGFMSFGKDLIIRAEFSEICRRILGGSPEGKHVTELLPSEQLSAGLSYENLFNEWFDMTDGQKRSMLLGLLPSRFQFGNRIVDVEFREIQTDTPKPQYVMVILTDVTEKMKLEELVASEQRRMKLIVHLVTHQHDCLELIAAYRDFSTQIRRFITLGEEGNVFEMDTVMRLIHTYKGNFAQHHFVYLPQKLHDLEERLMTYNPKKDEWKKLFLRKDLFELMQDDLEIITSVLGDRALIEQEVVTVNPQLIRNLEAHLQQRLSGPEADEMLIELRNMYYVSFHKLLKDYAAPLENLAAKLEKSIGPMVITGHDFRVDPQDIKLLNKSLIHLFRNSVDHGIEIFEERLYAGKEMMGKIFCETEAVNNEIHLVIGDDGKGIDPNTVRMKAFRKGLYPLEQLQQMSDSEVIQIIFDPQFSTRDIVTDLSGRGYGLNAVKDAVTALGGTIVVESKPGEGSRFRIKFPYEKVMIGQAVEFSTKS